MRICCGAACLCVVVVDVVIVAAAELHRWPSGAAGSSVRPATNYHWSSSCPLQPTTGGKQEMGYKIMMKPGCKWIVSREEALATSCLFHCKETTFSKYASTLRVLLKKAGRHHEDFLPRKLAYPTPSRYRRPYRTCSRWSEAEAVEQGVAAQSCN